MNIARLRKLIDFMKELPDEGFNFRYFVSEYDEEAKCSTVCCAAGWLTAVDPEEWAVRGYPGCHWIQARRDDTGDESHQLARYFETDRENTESLFYFLRDPFTPSAVLPTSTTRSEWIKHAESILSAWEDKIQDCSEETHE